MSDDAKNMVNQKVRFEKLSLKDEEEYVDFLMLAYKDQFNRDRFKQRDEVRARWRWEYIDNPAPIPDKPLVWICRYEGKIAGQLCVMPVEVKIKDNIYRGGWCQDLITLPDFRNAGLGLFLVRYALEEMRKFLDIAMVAGMNKNSYAIFKYSDFIDMGFMSRNIYVAKPFLSLVTDLFLKHIKIHLTLRGGSKIEVREEKRFDSRFDELWSGASNHFGCMIKRDRKALEWKFSSQKHWDYKIISASFNGRLKGYAVIKETALNKGRLRGLKIGVVSDILFDINEKMAGEALIKAVIDMLKGKVDVIRCDALNVHLQAIIKSAGFINLRSNNRFIIHPFNKELIKEATLFYKDRRNWYLTYGDSDIDLY